MWDSAVECWNSLIWLIRVTLAVSHAAFSSFYPAPKLFSLSSLSKVCKYEKYKKKMHRKKGKRWDDGIGHHLIILINFLSSTGITTHKGAWSKQITLNTNCNLHKVRLIQETSLVRFSLWWYQQRGLLMHVKINDFHIDQKGPKHSWN